LYFYEKDGIIIKLVRGKFSTCFHTGIIPMKYWKRGLKEMSDKTILEQWRSIAYDQQADRNKLQRFWANYFNIEKGIYEQLLTNPDEVVTGTVKELAEKYGQEVLTMVGFLDGINDSLKIPNPIETMDENTKVSLCFDKELLYKNMVDARADWLYELPQWDAIFTPEKRKELYLEQKKSGTVVKAKKIGRNDPCPCGSGKKYKYCCGKNA
jgi:uncharacterized protein